MSKGFRNRAFRAYQKVKTLKPARSLFDESHDVLATMDMGKCYPTCLMEMSPGDTFHIWQESVVRMQPLNAPILHDIFLFSHYFFVPYRILWEEWIAFITGGVDGENGGNGREDMPGNVTPELPRWRPSGSKNGVGSLWDYCGFPTGVIPEGALPLDFVRRCYNRIWNEYYRDETLQEEVDEANEDILFRNWKKDYFTSALVSQQRGISPAMPLNGSVISTSSRYTKNDSNCYPSSLSYSNITGVATFKIRFTIDSSSLPDVTIDNANQLNAFLSDTHVTIRLTIEPHTTYSSTFTASNIHFVRYDDRNQFVFEGDATAQFQTGLAAFLELDSAYADISFDYSHFNLNNVGSFDVKDLRVAFQIQRWLELANRGGVRYTEFLRSFFGVSPRDDRLQRPEYIGGSKSPIVISEVLQTSSTASEPTPQGNMAGHGVGASRTYIGSYTAVEFGMIMAITSIMPSAKYMQGINRQWLRRTKFDFLFPQFTGLSEQAIEQAEIYAEDTEAKNRKVWGFNEVYDELRSMPSRIVGKMRTVFDYWHLGRKFNSAPSLNSEFIKCNPSKRIFAVPSEDGFIVNIANIIRAVRPIPKYGTPKGV